MFEPSFGSFENPREREWPDPDDVEPQQAFQPAPDYWPPWPPVADLSDNPVEDIDDDVPLPPREAPYPEEADLIQESAESVNRPDGNPQASEAETEPPAHAAGQDRPAGLTAAGNGGQPTIAETIAPVRSQMQPGPAGVDKLDDVIAGSPPERATKTDPPTQAPAGPHAADALSERAGRCEPANAVYAADPSLSSPLRSPTRRSEEGPGASGRRGEHLGGLAETADRQGDAAGSADGARPVTGGCVHTPPLHRTTVGPEVDESATAAIREQGKDRLDTSDADRPDVTVRPAEREATAGDLPTEIQALVEVPDLPRDEGEAGTQPSTLVPLDWLTGRLVDVGASGLESSLWKAGEEVARHLHPLGPYVMRGLYLSRQIVEAFVGLRSGNGFYFKVSVPDLNLPAGLEVVFRIRLGYRYQDAAGYGFSAEIQVFEPWLPDLDIKRDAADTARKLASGIPAVYTPAAPYADPWRVWLVLIGDGLIHALAATLATAARRPAGEMLARLMAQRAVGRSETRLVPDRQEAA